MTHAATTEALTKFLDEVQARANAVIGPTAKLEDKEVFAIAARSDIPSMIRALRAVAGNAECPSCGVQTPVAEIAMRAIRAT